LVKAFVFLCLTVWLAWGDSAVLEKVRLLVGTERFVQNEAFIRIIFADEASFLDAQRVDVVRVIGTLKENGLISLFFDTPKQFELTFKTNGTPQFFMALMRETLREMGYSHYLTDSAVLTNAGYTWRISMLSEYATDPLALQRELSRRGCSILDIKRISETQWRYFIDMRDAHMKIKPLVADKKVALKRLIYPRWLDVSQVDTLTLWSLKGNNWYPYIAFYDDNLRLLKLYKRDKKSWQIIINLPRGCAYVKIADLYSRKNMKEGLRVKASSFRK